MLSSAWDAFLVYYNCSNEITKKCHCPQKCRCENGTDFPYLEWLARGQP